MAKATFASTPSPIPTIEQPRDAIVRVTATAICGSDLHLLDGYMPTMEAGDILGHEFMGEVVEVGRGDEQLKSATAWSCPSRLLAANASSASRGLVAAATTRTRTPRSPPKAIGHSPAGMFGYSHMIGGYAGGQAEYVRVPFADFGPIKVPTSSTDEQVLFLSDIFPTGYMAAENCDIEAGRHRCGLGLRTRRAVRDPERSGCLEPSG